MKLHLILDRQADKNVLSVTKLIENMEPQPLITHEEPAHNIKKYVTEHMFEIEGISPALRFRSAEIDIRPIPTNFCIEVNRSLINEPFHVSVRPDNIFSGNAEAPNALEAWLGVFSEMVRNMSINDLCKIFPVMYTQTILTGQYDYIYRSLVPISSSIKYRSWDSQIEGELT